MTAAASYSGKTDASYDIPASPTKTGYTFLGWFDQSQDGQSMTNELGTYPEANTTYYAHWKAVAATVTLNSPDGTPTSQNISGNYGDAVNYTIPERTGYAFSGWKIEGEADDTAQTILTMPVENTTYVAVWTAGANVVTFNPMGGTFAGEETGVRTGKTAGTYTVPAAPEKTGYDFSGWFTAPDGGTELEAATTTYSTVANLIYYAHWTAKKTAVTLDANGGRIGTASTVKMTGDYGTSIDYTNPTRDGYTFQGWAAASDAETGSRFPTYPAADTTLYAIWTANTVTLTFDPMEGSLQSGDSGTFTGAVDSSYSKPADPTRTGYDFSGWYTTATGSDVVKTFGTMPTADTTYYAHWTAKTIAVELNPNSGRFTDVDGNKTVRGIYGKIIDYTAPVRDGYVFKGWSEAADATEGDMYPVYPESTITLYAVWGASQVTVNFDPMGGSFGEGVQGLFTGVTGASYTVPEDPTKTGYDFQGWLLNTADTETVTPDGKYPESNMTYYAKWTAKQITLYLDPAGGSMDASGQIAEKTGDYNTVVQYTIPIRAGYQFLGWKLESEADTAARTSLSFPAADKTTYVAVWKANTITVTFEANGGKIDDATSKVMTGDPQGSLTAPTPTREGYTFAGWFTSPTGGEQVTEFSYGSADASYFAHWTADTIHVTMHNGTTDSSYSGDYDTVIQYTMPVKDGYAFIGWKLKDAEDSTATMFPLYQTDGAEYEPVWAVNEVNLTFYPAGGTFADGETGVRTGAAGSSYTAPADPTRAGYDFGGWYTDKECTNAATVNGTLPTASNTVYYAKWTIKQITVTLQMNGGNIASSTADVTKTGLYQETVAYTIPTRDGYTFLGWKLGTEEDSAARTSLSYPADDTTYLAVWKANPVTLLFEAMGGTFAEGETGRRDGLAEAAYTEPTEPTRTGYTFAGWYDKATNGTRVTLTGKLPTASTMLFAYWTEKAGYTVRYDSNGGSAVADKADVTWNQTGLLPETAPTRAGYTFTGWWYGENNGTRADAATAYGKLALDNDQTEKVTLVAGWTENQAIINYESEDTGKGTVAPATETVGVDNGPISGATAAPADGYHFVNWTNAADEVVSTTAAFTPAKASDGFYTAAIYIAHFAPNDYTVTFAPEGGTQAVTTKTVTFNGKYGSLPTPVKNGYDFAGWFTKADGGDAVTADTIYGTAGDVSIYAHWTAKIGYSVLYDENGGTAVADRDKTVSWTDSNLFPETAPTRTGYTLTGWKFAASDVKDGTTTYGDLAVSETVQSVTLVAQWKANPVTLTFDTGVESITTPDQTRNYDEAYGELPTVTRNGFTFDGWFTQATGGVKVEASDIVKVTEAGQTLYAHWTAKDGYTVRYDTKGGNTIAEKAAAWTDDNLLPTAPTRTGYTFAGWHVGLVTVTADTTYGELAGNDSVKEITLVAQWTAKSVTLEFNTGVDGMTVDAQTRNYDAIYGILPTITRIGYTFDGWFTQAEGGTAVAAEDFVKVAAESQTLYAHWTAKGGNTVTYDTAGGTAVAAKTDVKWTDTGLFPDAAATTTRTGYTLTGWLEKETSTAVEGTTTYGDLAGKLAADDSVKTITLVAQWTADTETLHFATGVDGMTVPDQNCTYDKPYGTLPVLTRAGYTFDGWFTQAEGGTPVADGDIMKVAGEQTLYAHWTANSATIRFESNGGSAVNGIAGKTDETITAKFPTDVPTRKGYAFEGWYADAACTEQVTAYPKAFPAGDTIYYAKWKKLTYTVTFDTNGGSAVAAQSVLFKELAAKPADPTRNGYTFVGWHLDTATGAEYDFATQVTDNVTLAAAWKAITYTMTFDLGGGTDTGNAATYTADGAVVLANPTKSGMIFAGWTGTDVDTPTLLVTIPKGSYGNRTYTAHWKLADTVVTYDGNGADAGIPQDTTAYAAGASVTVSSQIPSRTGYHFTGWLLNGTLYAAGNVFTLPAGGAVLTAQWSRDDYLVSFDTGTGGSNVAPQQVKGNSVVTKPADPVRNGYTFTGWYTGADQSVAFDFATPIKQETSIVAGWALNHYTISLDAGAEDAVLPDGEPTNYTIENGFTLVAPHREHYEFVGWRNANDPSAQPSETVTVGAGNTGSCSYVAVWKACSYSVSFSSAAAGEIPSQTIEYLGHVTKPASVPTRENYTFNGWYADSACTTPFNFDGAVLQDTTIWAGWTPVAYHLTYNLDGGSLDTGNPGTYTVETSAFTLGTPTRSGYEFVGWTGTGLDGTTMDVTILPGNAGDRVYTAVWAKTATEENSSADGTASGSGADSAGTDGMTAGISVANADGASAGTSEQEEALEQTAQEEQEKLAEQAEENAGSTGNDTTVQNGAVSDAGTQLDQSTEQNHFVLFDLLALLGTVVLAILAFLRRRNKDGEDDPDQQNRSQNRIGRILTAACAAVSIVLYLMTFTTGPVTVFGSRSVWFALLLIAAILGKFYKRSDSSRKPE